MSIKLYIPQSGFKILATINLPFIFCFAKTILNKVHWKAFRQGTLQKHFTHKCKKYSGFIQHCCSASQQKLFSMLIKLFKQIISYQINILYIHFSTDLGLSKVKYNSNKEQLYPKARLGSWPPT